MKHVSKCAIGGIVASLSLVLMISVAIVPFLTYALPAMAGAILVFAVIEIGKKWALGIYACVAILGIFLVPDKEVAVMYATFFGYYPILKAIIESKLNVILGWAAKVFTFLATIAGSYYLMIKLMNVTIDEIDEFGLVAIPILLGMGTFAFVIYDIALSKLVLLYNLKFRKHFKRYFK